MISLTFALLNFFLGLAFAPYLIEYFQGHSHPDGYRFFYYTFIWDFFLLLLIIAASFGPNKRLIPWMLAIAVLHNLGGAGDDLLLKGTGVSLVAILLVIFRIGPFKELGLIAKGFNDTSSWDKEEKQGRVD